MKVSPIGFRRVNHVSWAVTDIDMAVDLYVKLLGAHVVYESRLTDVKEIRMSVAGRDYWTSISKSIGLECRSMLMLELLDGFRIELFHVEKKSTGNVLLFQRDRGGQNCLSLEVDNIDQATRYLLGLGFRVFEVISSVDSSISGYYYRYFLDPWGNSFKLVSAA